MASASKGFTLVELVVVVLLLALLAATALPRFFNVSPQARIAALENLKGGLLSGASLANAKCRFTDGCFESGWASGTITSPDGTSGRMYNGYPTSNATAFASHITKWVDVTGFVVDTSNNLFTDFFPEGNPGVAGCRLRYHYAVALGQAPDVVLSTSDC